MADAILWEGGDRVLWAPLGDVLVWETAPAALAGYWTDTFIRSDAASLGSDWKDIEGGWAISGNRAVPESAGSISVWNKSFDFTAYGPDYSVYARVNKTSGEQTTIGVLGRFYKKDNINGYLALVRNVTAGTDNVELWSISEGVFSLLDSEAQEWTNGSTLQLKMVGNTISVLMDGVVKCSATSNAHNYISGTAGVRASHASGAITEFSAAAEGTSVISNTSGHVTSTTARIGVLLSASGNVKIRYSTSSDLSAPTTTAAVASAVSEPYWAQVDISSLTANTQYYYEVLVDDTVKQYTPYSKFKTLPTGAGQVKFAFVSCAFMFDKFLGNINVPYPEYDRVFTHINTWAPDAWGFFGDLGYVDQGDGTTASSTAAHFRAQYRSTVSARSRTSQYAMLRRNIPTYTMWDDHEIINDFNGASDASLFTNAIGEFRKFYKSNPDDNYYDFSIRDVDFFVTDTRQHRSANNATDDGSKTILGSTQKTDLKAWLSASTARFKVIVSTTKVDSLSATDNDCWGEGFTTELYEMWDYITSNRISGVLWLTGDAHAHGVYKTTRSGRLNYSVCASPANHSNIAPPPGSDTDAQTIYQNATLAEGWTRLTMDTSVTPATIFVELVNASNVVENSTTITLSDLDNALLSGGAAWMHYTRMRH